jgi:hypothetical protein
MQSAAYLTFGALAGLAAGVAAGLVLVLGQQQTDISTSQPTVVPLRTEAGAASDFKDPYSSIMDPAAYAAQRVLTPEEKAATAFAMLPLSDSEAFSRQAEAEWTAEQREQHTESLAAILDPVAYDRATRGSRTGFVRRQTRPTGRQLRTTPHTRRGQTTRP